MKTNILSGLVVVALIMAFAGIVPASANKMVQHDERIQGTVESQTLFAGDNGQNYLIIGTNDNLGMYIGKQVIAEGLVTDKSPKAGTEDNIRIEHLDAVR